MGSIGQGSFQILCVVIGPLEIDRLNWPIAQSKRGIEKPAEPVSPNQPRTYHPSHQTHQIGIVVIILVLLIVVVAGVQRGLVAVGKVIL